MASHGGRANPVSRRRSMRRRIAALSYRALYWGRHSVAPGMRSLLGLLLMIGGVFGFLPVLGFWMFPLGVAFVALDLPLTRGRIDLWMLTLAHDAGITPPGPDQPTSSQ